MRPSSSPQPEESALPEAGGTRRPWGLALLAAVVVAGLALERLGVLDWRAGLELARGYSDQWWLAPALALVTAGLFAASLPGSLMVWVVGILLPPEVAAPVFVAGGVVGALGAYGFARITGGRNGDEVDESRLLALLARRSDLATLVALRIAPGVPHSAINVAAGILGVPLGRFLVSTACGLAAKAALYVLAIHQATRAATLEGAITWRTVAPLAALSILLLLAPPLLRRLRGPRTPATVPVESP